MRTHWSRLPLLSALTFAAAFGGGAGAAVPPAAGATLLPRPFRPTDVNAICYGPHRDGQSPGHVEPTAAQLRQDLDLLAPRWRLLRLYGAVGFADTLLSIIREDSRDVQVLLGIWIAPDDDAANRREIDAAVRLAAAYPEIVAAVCVGNETQVFWSDHRCAPAALLDALREVRSRVTVPVTTADDFNFWNKPESREVAAAVDFILLHAHPLWNGRQLDEALPWLQERVAEVAALHPDRTIVIGETGWATQRADEGDQGRLMKGRLGEPEQKTFHDQARAWAAATGTVVFFFEAFDENWKGGPHPDEVEKHWGLWRADRAPKQALQD